MSKRDDIYEQAVELHRQLAGKIEINPKLRVKNSDDLAKVYSPGVAEVSRRIHKDPSLAFDYTLKHNTVAIVSDGSAVLGLGNIGAEAAIPVMEGKAMLFKAYADIDAFPICVRTQKAHEIVEIVKNISPVFAGINLEDIAAPKAFEVESALQDIGIPVFHDDQHGTAIVALAAIINAAKLRETPMNEMKIVINGAGAAGSAIAEMLLCTGHDLSICEPVREMLVCDSRGIISANRLDITTNAQKMKLAMITNRGNQSGKLADAIKDADVFIGVSVGNVLTREMVESMADRPVILAMANPEPEIDPQLAKDAGAFIIATGRSDYPNQVNNVLAFPGVFRGAIDARAPRITNHMKINAAHALANATEHLSTEHIIPSALDKAVAYRVGARVKAAWEEEQELAKG
ncbi:MAG: NAD(P)-dependent malic enzyme [Bacteroidota bacterium]